MSIDIEWYKRQGITTDDIGRIIVNDGFIQYGKHRPDGSVELELPDIAVARFKRALDKKLEERTSRGEDMGNVDDFWEEPEETFEDEDEGIVPPEDIFGEEEIDADF